jgi:hypothetical protein
MHQLIQPTTTSLFRKKYQFATAQSCDDQGSVEEGRAGSCVLGYERRGVRDLQEDMSEFGRKKDSEI